jgi:hypothetical protein
VENDEDDRVVGDGTMPAPAVHREEVAIKTVVASMVHKGNLEEAQHGTPGMDKTEGRVIEIQLPPPAVCNTDPGDLAGVKEKRILDLVYLNGYVPFCTQRVQGTLVLAGHRWTPRATRPWSRNGDLVGSDPRKARP